MRGAWIEMEPEPDTMESIGSLPVRGAWIEMMNAVSPSRYKHVAPCEGSVD